MGNLLGVLVIIIVFIIWASIRSHQIQRDRIKKIKIILDAVDQLMISNDSDMQLNNIAYNDARDVMNWFFQIQNLHLYHPDMYKKPSATGEIGELIEKFKAK
ncbi:hypothetical protein LJC23_00960 [Desulfovibrio sp. OttesenSCG-928-I05]|nr:hypothetical protein [Desulfovibrio sp. OttesenSCG-928-I05]